MTNEEAIKIIDKGLDIGKQMHFLTVEQMNEAKQMAIKALESCSENPNRWIPISERLPKNKSYVLTTIRIPGRVPHVRSGWYQEGFFHNDNGDVWNDTDPEVTAWMPLPEPYTEEQT